MTDQLEQLWDQMTANCKGLADFNGLISQLTQRFLERALEAEMKAHLGYKKHERRDEGRRENARNGTTSKTVEGTFGQLEINTPRDRDATFEPQIIKKRQVRLAGLEEKILSLYARGLQTREIAEAIEDLYGAQVSHTVVAEVTQTVQEEVRAWRSRPLESIYAVVWIDGIRAKVREEGRVVEKTFYTALGLDLEGCKEVLGLWSADHEGARFWHQVMQELQSRGVKDVFVVCMDGLKGLPEAVKSVFKHADTQLCIVHLVRASLRYSSSKDSKALATALKAIYRAPTLDAAQMALDQFEEQWGKLYPAIVKIWRNNWAHIIPFFRYPAAIRKVIYTTNIIESLHAVFRKFTRGRKIFASEEAAMRDLYLAIRISSKRWVSLHGWSQALQSFQILVGDERLPIQG